MNWESGYQRYLRGWFPQEPALQAKSVTITQENRSVQKENNRKMLVNVGIYSIIWCFIGILFFFSKHYLIAAVNFGCIAFMLSLSYGIYRYNLTIRLRFTLTAAFIMIGALGIFFNDALFYFMSFPGTIAYSLLSSVEGVGIFVGVTAAILVVLPFVAWKLIIKEKLLPCVRSNFAVKRQLIMPFAAIAILLATTYLVITSGFQYEYAIPITLIVAGFLVLRGLDRFAKTIPTLLALLFCIMFLGTAVAGAFTVTYVPENHWIATADAPNVNVVNLNVNTNQADIHVYFTDDTAKICQVSFIKQYGPTVVGSRAEYHPKDTYDNEPTNNLNYTVQDQQLLVYVDCYSTLVNVTLSQDLSYNLNLFSYFGWITVHNSSSIQSGNYTTQWGHVQRLQN